MTLLWYVFYLLFLAKANYIVVFWMFTNLRLKCVVTLLSGTSRLALHTRNLVYTLELS